MIERIQGTGNQGPYSQGVIVGEWVYTSGQIPVIPGSGEIVTGSIEAQAQQALANLRTVLESCGVTVAQVVKVTVYLTDLGDFARFNQVYMDFFAGVRPARSCVQVAALPRGVSIEVEAIAHRG